MRFQIGDKVRIREDLVEAKEEYFYVDDAMLEYAGEEATITDIKVGDIWHPARKMQPVGYALDIDGGLFGWEDNFLEEESQ